MAASEVSTKTNQPAASDDIQDEDSRMRLDESTDELHQQHDQKQQQEALQESHQDNNNLLQDNDRPGTFGERSETTDYRSESPAAEARAETPQAAGDAESFDNDKETDDYYDLATQQLQLQQELQKLKDEGILPQSDEPVFDYDIAERVKQLNAELEKEESTPEKKNRRVNFSNNLVEFSPSPEISGEDAETSGLTEEGQTDPNDLEVARLTLSDDTPHQEDGESQQRLPGDSNSGTVSASGDTGANGLPNENHLDRLSAENRFSASNEAAGTDQPDAQLEEKSEQILLERNGEFELVNVKDLSAEERFMMGLEPVEERNSNNSANSSTSGATGFQPSPPPRKQRPSTASGQVGVRRQQLQPRRIQSAKTHREVHGANGQSLSALDWDARSSGYGLSPEQRADMRKAYRMQLQRQKEEQDQREEEKRRIQEESEAAFQWWLEKKREEDKQKRKEERERKKMELMEKEGETQDPESTYKAWLENKKEQAKFERQMKKKMEEEKERAFYVRDRKDCDKAFKEWLRSKNSQLQEDKSMKRSSASQSQKRAKLSRKSRQLAKALQIAETYRYTDYYGYRF